MCPLNCRGGRYENVLRYDIRWMQSSRRTEIQVLSIELLNCYGIMLSLSSRTRHYGHVNSTVMAIVSEARCIVKLGSRLLVLSGGKLMIVVNLMVSKSYGFVWIANGSE
ncbi:hypothetical protein D5086_018168 [Populus alba]|uniref:Uncharacterized protein n=1 Tax=Populus alba TaxID=43335 RepID=A0ACC4BNX3_POPAL